MVFRGGGGVFVLFIFCVSSLIVLLLWSGPRSFREGRQGHCLIFEGIEGSWGMGEEEKRRGNWTFQQP